MFAIIAALATIIGTSAFNEAPEVKKEVVDHYLRFDGDDNSTPEIRAAGNWADLGTAPPSLTCNEADGTVCYIKYNGDLAAFQSYVANKSYADIAGMVQKFRE